MATWIRLGEIQAQEIQCQPYSETLFKKALWEIRSLTGTPVDSWQKSIEALCSPSGVAFTLVKEIPKCPVSGLTRWLTPDKALIQMTIRYKTDDHFWFTFFHEAGHILNDSKKTVFLDVNHDDDESEAKANKFAAEWLIPPKYAKALPNLKSHADVINFAKEIGIAPGIVVGQMQKKEIIPWSSFLSKLKRKIKWGDE
jgi:hypothetical protein